MNPSYYYYYQALGHIDTVSRRLASGFFRGAARVLFITTSDTSVGTTDTLREANNRGVGIWKAIVCRTTPNSNSFQVGSAIPLNPGIYSQTPVPGSPGLVTGLSQPGSTPSGYEDADGGY
ncbi:hypothetical protein [Chroococcidiopsis sp. TS-821]|uniref:hypothetical protein n=1 Tax=Chroococcidiopsis sp. TS-821 TaxID=1378066 RepID=UPI000CEDEC89|nr:hypothetical protein [Chroococcidiopsis sp. TS-821]PPS45833.1 hypothetical protein B1A85_06260 [Chroococcidiopsis sp. TS-821]